MPLQTHAGQPSSVEFVSSVYLVDQAPESHCGILDITERKSAQEKLKQPRKHHEGEVRKRTNEMQTRVPVMSGHEVRMAELKKAIEKLLLQMRKAGIHVK